MKIPESNKLLSIIKSFDRRLRGLKLRFFNPEKLPQISMGSVNFFKLKNHHDDLMIMEGLVSIPAHEEIPELKVKSGKNHLGSLMFNPLKNRSVETHEAKKTFSFSHYAFIPDSKKRIRIISKATHNTIIELPQGHKEILPFPYPENTSFLSEYNTGRPYPKNPLKVLLVTHNLNIEGAPKVLLEIAKGLHKNTLFAPFVLSLLDGPLKSDLQNLNIPVIVISDFNQNNSDCIICQDIKLNRYHLMLDVLDKEKPDIVFANTIINSFAVNAAHVQNIPSVWMIHESNYPAATQNMFEYCSYSDNLKAFMVASRIVFCSQSTMKIYEAFDIKKRFTVIRNAAETKFESLKLSQGLKAEARQNLNIPDKTITLLNVGVLHENKNQLLIINALRHIKNRNFRLYLVGAKPNSAYAKVLSQAILAEGLEAKVIIVPEQMDTLNYFLAADIYILPSLSESYPLTILEAMACGLPILTSPVYGVNEQVKFGENAFSISPTDEIGLSRYIEVLMDNKEKRILMGKKSRIIFDSMPNLEAMVTSHSGVIFSVWKEAQNTSKC